jgi:hypothetical protein
MYLTNKRRVFVEEYLRCWNGSEAARRAGYAHPGSQANYLLKNIEIQKIIAKRLKEKAMCSDEVLARLGEQARVSVADFLDERGNLDLEAVKKMGHLIKSITDTRYGKRIELHDGQAALVHVGRHLGLFTDRTELVGEGGGPLVVKIVGADPDA